MGLELRFGLENKEISNEDRGTTKPLMANLDITYVLRKNTRGRVYVSFYSIFSKKQQQKKNPPKVCMWDKPRMMSKPVCDLHFQSHEKGQTLSCYIFVASLRLSQLGMQVRGLIVFIV